MAAPPKRSPTLQDKIKETRDLEETIAVKRALVAYLRTRYLPSDARPKPFQIECKGSPVSIEVIQKIHDQLDAEADEAFDELNALVKEVM